MRNKLKTIDTYTRAVISGAFPAYRGRKVYVNVLNGPIDTRSYWDGGSRDYFTFYNLETHQTLSVPPQSAFDKPIAGADAVSLPIGFVCIEHSIFCGKDAGITIHVNPADNHHWINTLLDRKSNGLDNVIAANQVTLRGL